MAIKVTKIDNLFGNNGSWEKPIAVPDHTEFTEFPKLLVTWDEQKITGTVILKGEGNYAYCEGNYYFLRRILVADRDSDNWDYALLKDFWVSGLINEVSIKGFCTKTSRKQLLLDNINFVTPAIDNPVKQLRLNLNTDITRHWGQDVNIKEPTITAEQFRKLNISDKDGGLFIKDCKEAPVKDSLLKTLTLKKDGPNKKGVTIIGELQSDSEVSSGKGKILEKVKTLIKQKEFYSLSKVGEDNLGKRAKIKNKYVLTPTASGGIGTFEETARVIQLDFSNGNDVAIVDAIEADGTERLAEFVGDDLSETTLSKKYQKLDTVTFDKKAKSYRVLQRKVYFPYLKKNGSTNKDYLYQGHIEAELTSGARAQDISELATYAEADPLVPVYQGYFAQALKSKAEPTKAFFLPGTYQLDTAFNGKLEPSKTTQLASDLNKNIPFYNEDNAPEFGFLIFNPVRDRKDGTGWHYKGTTLSHLDILTGLKADGNKPVSATYDRDVKPWVDRVTKGGTNFQLLNALYPYSWVYYFSVLRDNKLKISYHDGKDWGGTSGGFDTKPNQEGEVDFSTYDIKKHTERNIDNNLLDINYFDKVRNQFFATRALTTSYPLVVPLYKDDIFFNDLQAFWEEYEDNTESYYYTNDNTGYLDTKKNHRKLEKNYKKTNEYPKLVFYGNNNIKKYQIGVYYTYTATHSLDKKDNDIIGINFKDSNYGTAKNLETLDNLITEKTVRYHHISQVRNLATKAKAADKEFNLQNFTSWSKTKVGNEILTKLNNLLNEVHLKYSYYHSGTDPYTRRFQVKYGVENSSMLFTLPKIGKEGNVKDLYNILNIKDYVENVWEADVPYGKTFSQRGVSSVAGLGLGLFHAGAESADAIRNDRYIDLLKFGNNQGIACHSHDGYIKEIKKIIDEQIKPLFEDPIKGLGQSYAFDNIDEFIKKLNTKELQQDIYKALKIIDEKGRYETDVVDFTDRLFDLVGTGYGLGLDAEENPHLVFKNSAIKTDLDLDETKVFRLPCAEVPRQDYIDAINQKTLLSVATAEYPLEERLLFKEPYNPIMLLDDEEYDSNNFSVKIHRFSIENKSNISDYFIINYEGARQLLDIKMAIPKRTLAETRATDVVATAQLAFDQEKGREEFKNRNSFFQYHKDRQEEQMNLADKQWSVDAAKLGLTSLVKLINPIENMAFSSLKPSLEPAFTTTEYQFPTPNGSQYILKTRQFNPKFAPTTSLIAKTGIGVYNALSDTALGVTGLAFQAEELASRRKFIAGQLFVEEAKLDTEHHFNERAFAFKALNLGNVYTQGEVNDRDITDKYLELKNLNEVHLIYRIPSEVQREAIERLYILFGVNCQIPDVTLKFNQLEAGDIGQFAFIDEFTNVWATEEKDAIKNILANGVKIINNRNVRKLLIPEKAVSWEARMNEILSEANEEQRQILFNKLAIGVEQIEIIKKLAENIPDKNDIIELLAKYLDKENVLAKVLRLNDEVELTKIILKLLDGANKDQIFEELLSEKDKEHLIESGIDKGTNLKRILWDKYADETISKELHDSKLSDKEDVINRFRQELKDFHQEALKVQDSVAGLNERNTALIGEIDQQKLVIEQKDRRIDSLEETVRTTKEELNSEKEISSKSAEAFAKEEKEHNILKERFSTLSESYRNLESEKGEETKLKALYLAESQKFKKELQSCKEEKDSQKLQIDKQIEELTKLRLLNKWVETKGGQDEVNRNLENLAETERNLGVKDQQISHLTEKLTELRKKLVVKQGQGLAGKTRQSQSDDNLFDTYKAVDYLITKKVDDKLAITMGNAEKNIGQEQSDLVIKRRDETKLLRIANKAEKYETGQYPLGSYYRNQHGSKYNITVSTFSILDNYINDKNIKNAHAWVGRYSVEIDKNIPYLDKDGNWVKPYGYHKTKGGFDYDIKDGAKKVSSYEEYKALVKNAIGDLRKELVEKENTITALRELEKGTATKVYPLTTYFGTWAYIEPLVNVHGYFRSRYFNGHSSTDGTGYYRIVTKGAGNSVLIADWDGFCYVKRPVNVISYRGGSLWGFSDDKNDVRSSLRGYYRLKDYGSSYSNITTGNDVKKEVMSANNGYGQATLVSDMVATVVESFRWPIFEKTGEEYRIVNPTPIYFAMFDCSFTTEKYERMVERLENLDDIPKGFKINTYQDYKIAIQLSLRYNLFKKNPTEYIKDEFKVGSATYTFNQIFNKVIEAKERD